MSECLNIYSKLPSWKLQVAWLVVCSVCASTQIFCIVFKWSICLFDFNKASVVVVVVAAETACVLLFPAPYTQHLLFILFFFLLFGFYSDCITVTRAVAVGGFHVSLFSGIVFLLFVDIQLPHIIIIIISILILPQ